MAYELRDFSDVAPATTIASDITNVSTSLTVASGTGYPSGGAAGDFIIQVESELIRCSARSGTSFTVSGGVAGRGINGTTAVGHVTGVAVNHVHTAVNDSKEANYAVSKTVGKVTTSQDMIVADAVNSFTRLPIGANGTILQALAGSVAYSALPANCVGASQITDGTVGSAELAAGSVIAGKIGVGGISAANQFATGVVDSTAILDGTIVNGDIGAAAAIAMSKLSVDPTARANHTGTQLANTISNFDTQVRTSTLNQMAAPTTDLAIGTHKLTGVSDPTVATDASTKNYQDTKNPLTSSTYTPVMQQSATTISKTIGYAHYVQIGSVVIATVFLTLTSNGPGGAGPIYITLPVNAAAPDDTTIGGCRLSHGASIFVGSLMSTTSATRCYADFSSLIASPQVTSTDVYTCTMTYIVA